LFISVNTVRTHISFSPHYIGSSFSTNYDTLGLTIRNDVSVPIISGLLFQLQALLLIINDLQT